MDLDDKALNRTWIPVVQWFFWDVVPKRDDEDVGGALVMAIIVGDGPYTVALNVQLGADLRQHATPERSELLDDLVEAKIVGERWVAERVEQLRHGLAVQVGEA